MTSSFNPLVGHDDWIIRLQRSDGTSTSVDFRRWLYKRRPRLDGFAVFPKSDRFRDAKRYELVQECLNAAESMRGQVLDITLNSYLCIGLRYLFDYLDQRAPSATPVRSVDDITADLIQKYVNWIDKRRANTSDGFYSLISKRTIYFCTRNALLPFVRNNRIDAGIFPEKPFPYPDSNSKREAPYSESEMQRIVQALTKDVITIREGKFKPESRSQTLGPYLLLIAALTGRNTTSLLELDRDCLETHPIDSKKMLLRTSKRRAGAISKLAVTRTLNEKHRVAKHSFTTIDLSVVSLIEDVLKLTAEASKKATGNTTNLLWVFEENMTRGRWTIKRLVAPSRLSIDIARRHGLRDDNGQRLTPSISRFRQMMSVKLSAQLTKNPESVAQIMGHGLEVNGQHYSPITEEMRRNFRFCGFALESLAKGLTNTEDDKLTLQKKTNLSRESIDRIFDGTWNTGVGRCSSPYEGRFAPKNGSVCTNFVHCFRCPNLVIVGTPEDLHRLYSFYWAIVKRRDLIGKRNWRRYFRYVIRVIDDEIAPKFSRSLIAGARSRAYCHPHPMWAKETEW